MGRGIRVEGSGGEEIGKPGESQVTNKLHWI